MGLTKSILLRTLSTKQATTLRALKHLVSGEPELRWIPRLTDCDRASLDVGANVGAYSWWLVRHSTECFAFEPNPTLAQALAHVHPRLHVRQMALSDKAGKAILTIPIDTASGQERPGLASLAKSPGGRACRSFAVSTGRLDDQDLPPVGFIKIDVEGHEMAVLRGGEDFIGAHRPTVLIEAEERHRRGTVAAVADWFGTRAYQGYWLDGKRWRPLRDFDPHEHQNAENILPNGRRAPGKQYINNFLFIANDGSESVQDRLSGRRLSAGARREGRIETRSAGPDRESTATSPSR